MAPDRSEVALLSQYCDWPYHAGMESFSGARSLFHDLQDRPAGSDAMSVLEAWLSRALPAYGGLLDKVSVAPRTAQRDAALDSGTLRALFELYALSRVNDVLLGDAYSSAAVPEQDYRAFFAALGMQAAEASEYDPFLHEIASVEQSSDPAEPITVTAVQSPALMAGEMLFARARVHVRAGADHAAQGWADATPLFWTFARRGRRAIDLSHGWGSNSQWSTTFRRDYRTVGADMLNVDASDNADLLDPEDTLERLLTPAERREIVQNRCLVVPPAAVQELDQHPDWKVNLWPFGWRVVVLRRGASTPQGTVSLSPA